MLVMPAGDTRLVHVLSLAAVQPISCSRLLPATLSPPRCPSARVHRDSAWSSVSQLSLPKLIVFKEGEALDYNGEFTKASIIETMLREASRDTVQTLRTVKQAERFLHLDSWSSQHADEEKPPRVVGFFPSNQSKGYGVFRDAARKLQGLITFGECFDAAMQKKFLGAPTRRAVIQLVKADKRERKLTYTGPLAQPPLSRWMATHSVALVQDLSTESSIEALMAIGVPVFLLLMPDSYEEELAELIASFRAVASRVRERLLFGYGFKDTEPWPQFAQQLGIAPSATGAYWMIVGNGMDVTGRDWSTAWLRPPSLGFQIYAMDARGKETAEDVTEAKIQNFVDMFHGQLLKLGEPPWMTQWEAVAEEDEEVADAPVDSADGAGSSAGEVAAREYDKTLRKLIGHVQMNFNSGVAQLKKALDDLVDTPHLLPSRVPALLSTLSSTDNKLKKDLLMLKRELMDIGKEKDKQEL